MNFTKIQVNTHSLRSLSPPLVVYWPDQGLVLLPPGRARNIFNGSQGQGCQSPCR